MLFSFGEGFCFGNSYLIVRVLTARYVWEEWSLDYIVDLWLQVIVRSNYVLSLETLSHHKRCEISSASL